MSVEFHTKQTAADAIKDFYRTKKWDSRAIVEVDRSLVHIQDMHRFAWRELVTAFNEERNGEDPMIEKDLEFPDWLNGGISIKKDGWEIHAYNGWIVYIF